MRYFNAVKVLNRMSLVFIAGNLVAMYFSVPPLRGYSYLWLCLCNFFIHLARNREGFLKHIFILITFMPVVFLSSAYEIVFTLIVFLGSVYYIWTTVDKLSFSQALSAFKIEYKMIFASSLMSVLILGAGPVNDNIVPYILVYLITHTVVLRTTRFIEENREDERINKINALYGTASTIVAFIISVEEVRLLLGKFFKLIYEGILRIIFYLISPVIILISKVVDMLIGALLGNKQIDLPDMGGTGEQNNLGNNIGETILEKLLQNEVVMAVLQVATILGIIYVVYRLVKKYWSYNPEALDRDFVSEEKEAIDRNGTGGSGGIFSKIREAFRTKTIEEQIRYNYAKLLKVLKNRGVEIKKNDTSLEVNKKSEGIYDRTILEEIREIYIEVRYGERRGDRDKLKRIAEMVKKK